MHKIRKMDKKKLFLVVQVVIIILLCFLHALGAGHYANFVPLNGTFQNYNPVRRFLSGQIPYRDFQDYLGLGHLYVGLLTTVLMGGGYRKSLIAFSFLSIFSLACISVVLGYAITRSKKSAYTFTILLLAMVLIQPLIYLNGLVGTGEIEYALRASLSSGNSARYLRGMILPITILLLYLGVKLYRKFNVQQKPERKRKIIVLALVSFTSGFAFVWSNDYGISCWVCIAIMYFWMIFSRERKFFKAVGAAFLQVAMSLVSIFVCVEIFTFGHFPQWIKSTFGYGGYQSWYYLTEKSFYITDVDFSYLMMIQAGICIIYLIKIFQKKGTQGTVRYAIPAYANMVSFCAVNEYHLISGNSAREYALAVLLLTGYYELIVYLAYIFREKKQMIKRVAVALSLIISVSWIIDTAKDEFEFSFLTVKKGKYVEQMGGNVTTYGSDLLDTTSFLGDSKVFATYASAIETITDQFQPSGIDYIIHVMGDEVRDRYMDSFRTGSFDYVATLKYTLTENGQWEYWIERANWFFYRELFENWHPVYANAYEMFWEKNPEGMNNLSTSEDYDIKVTTETVDDSTIKIVVETDESVDGIADLFIDYEVKKNGSKSSYLLFNKMLLVENTGTTYVEDNEDLESNYLRDKSAEYIPVTIVDGQGEVTISSCPEKSTNLELYTVECSKIYRASFTYIDVSEGMKEYKGKQAVCAKNNDRNKDILEGTSEILMDGQWIPFSLSENKKTLYLIFDQKYIAPWTVEDILRNRNVFQVR